MLSPYVFYPCTNFISHYVQIILLSHPAISDVYITLYPSTFRYYTAIPSMPAVLVSLYIPLRSDNTYENNFGMMSPFIFISHYVQIIQKNVKCIKTFSDVFISHYVQIIRGGTSYPSPFLKLYIPLRSDNTKFSILYVYIRYDLYIPLRSDNTPTTPPNL